MLYKKRNTKIYLTLFLLILTISCQSQDTQDKTVSVHLRGVPVANISLMPLTGVSAYKPIKVYDQIKGGQSVVFSINKNMIPGDFRLQFEYIDLKSGQPTSSEQRVFVNKQNVSLNINPMFTNVSDSIIIARTDKENIVYQNFIAKNQSFKENLGLIQLVLTKYDDKTSDFYKTGINEYKKKSKQHTDWIDQQIAKHKDLFVSHAFIFQKMPYTDFTLDNKARKNAMLENYIDIIDYKDTFIIHTFDYRLWLDNYVNMHLDRHFSFAQTDSALTMAGKKIIEKSKAGHPVVYGRMIDYFFEGYESMGLEVGIKMLSEYANDPKCIATKKHSILKRIEGLEHIKIGTIAPNFSITDIENNVLNFHNFGKLKPFKLLMIWSADCEHCQDIIKQLYPYYSNTPVNSKFDVLAVSIDATETEIPVWENKIKELPKWRHAIEKGGLLSTVAKKYYVVSTPVMVIIDTKTNEIVSLPETARDIAMFFNNH